MSPDPRHSNTIRHRADPRRGRPLWLVPLVVLALATTSALLSTGRSVADVSLGTLSVAPSSGTADATNVNLTTVSASTPAGCPDTAAQATVTVTGPGGWAAGVSFNALRSVGSGDELTIPLSPTFQAAAAQAGVAIVAGRYDVTVTCTDRLATQNLGSFTSPIWFTDSATWQDTDPATTTTLTKIALTDAPAGRADLGADVTLTATLTPAGAKGTVRFYERVADTASPIGGAVPVAAGQATLTTNDLTFGLHYLTARFVPTDPKVFSAVTTSAPDLNFVVAHPQPGP